MRQVIIRFSFRVGFSLLQLLLSISDYSRRYAIEGEHVLFSRLGKFPRKLKKAKFFRCIGNQRLFVSSYYIAMVAQVKDVCAVETTINPRAHTACFGVGGLTERRKSLTPYHRAYHCHLCPDYTRAHHQTTRWDVTWRVLF